jgi:hypothetical protein
VQKHDLELEKIIDSKECENDLTMNKFFEMENDFRQSNQIKV